MTNPLDTQLTTIEAERALLDLHRRGQVTHQDINAATQLIRLQRRQADYQLKAMVVQLNLEAKGLKSNDI